MSIFSRIAALFFPPGPPRLNRDGHDLWWDFGKWQRIAVLCDGGAVSIPNQAVALVNNASYPGVLFQAQSLLPETRNAFFGSRDTYQGAIVIQPHEMTSSPRAWRCTSDLRYDKRTGEMRNALIEWNIAPGDWAGNRNRLLHELGHCLGLAHCDGTIMQASMTDWSKAPWFNDAQVRYLRGLRK